MAFDPISIAAIAGVGLQVLGLKKARDAEKKAKQSDALQREGVKISNYQTVVDALREYRTARAQVISGSVNAGAGIGSSGAQGVASSLSSQIRANVATFSKLDELGQQANQLVGQAQRAAGRSAFLGTLGQTALAVGQLIGQRQDPGTGVNPSVFSPGQPKQRPSSSTGGSAEVFPLGSNPVNK